MMNVLCIILVLKTGILIFAARLEDLDDFGP